MNPASSVTETKSGINCITATAIVTNKTHNKFSATKILVLYHFFGHHVAE